MQLRYAIRRIGCFCGDEKSHPVFLDVLFRLEANRGLRWTVAKTVSKAVITCNVGRRVLPQPRQARFLLASTSLANATSSVKVINLAGVGRMQGQERNGNPRWCILLWKAWSGHHPPITLLLHDLLWFLRVPSSYDDHNNVSYVYQYGFRTV
jgi:hypothetical protein